MKMRACGFCIIFTMLINWYQSVRPGFNMKKLTSAFIVFIFLAGCTSTHTKTQTDEFIKQAKSGNLDALLQAGQAFENGSVWGISFLDSESKNQINSEGGIKELPESSFYFYNLAANQASPEAEYKLGSFYATGYGTKQDRALSVSWLTKSADHGYLEAQAKLGYIYYSGEGSDKDSKKALYWLGKAADSGSSESMFYLGDLYRSGDGINIDVNKSFQYMKKSVEHGYAPAIPELAFMYVEGKGVAKNDSEFLRLIKAGADKQDERSMYTLAGLYFNGILVDQDYEKAAKWYDFVASDPKYANTKEMNILAKSKLSEREAGLMLSHQRQALQSILSADKNVCVSLGFKDKTDPMANCMLTQQVRRDQALSDQNRQGLEAAKIEQDRQIEAARIQREIAVEEERQAAVEAERDHARREAIAEGIQSIIKSSYQPIPVVQPPQRSVQTIRICNPNIIGDCR